MKLNVEPLNHSLPLDVLVETLSRLDLKTLFRLKCVSRSCRDFLSDPSFVDLHSQKMMKNVKILYSSSTARVPDGKDDRVLSFYAMHRQSNRFEKLSTFTSSFPHHVCPVSCDLVCFISHSNIYVCNPSTHDLRVLPKPSARLIYSCLGFGFSAQVGEYKVVHLSSKRSKAVTEIKGMECEVFTISSRTKIDSSSWKPLVCPRNVCPETISTNGRIYWLIDKVASFRHLNFEEFILSFDIANETFSTLPQPSDWPSETHKNIWPLDRNKYSVVFMVMDGKLCIADKSSLQKKAILDVWMLKDDCLWTKIYSVNLRGCKFQNGVMLRRNIIRQLCPECLLGGSIVMKQGDSRVWFSCCEESRTLYQIDIPDIKLKQKYHICEIEIPHRNFGIFWESLFRLQ